LCADLRHLTLLSGTMNVWPYSADEFCQDDVSGLAMQAIMFGNGPVEDRIWSYDDHYVGYR